MAFSVPFQSTFSFFHRRVCFPFLINSCKVPTHSHSLFFSSLLCLRSSLYRLCACARVCSLRCRSVKLWGCESLQHGSSAQLCTHGDASMTTVPIGNAIATTLTKRGKNRCAEFLHCRVSLSYSLSQHFLHYSYSNRGNHIETLFKREILQYSQNWSISKIQRKTSRHTYILDEYILILTKTWPQLEKMINVHWKWWGIPYGPCDSHA